MKKTRTKKFAIGGTNTPMPSPGIGPRPMPSPMAGGMAGSDRGGMFGGGAGPNPAQQAAMAGRANRMAAGAGPNRAKGGTIKAAPAKKGVSKSMPSAKNMGSMGLKCGGKAKGYAKGGGVEQRGKTRGKFV